MKGNVSSWIECSELCREDITCGYWTWNTATKQCSKRISKSEETNVSQHISGARDCGRDVCEFQRSVTPGNRYTVRKMGQETGYACAVKCLELQQTESDVSGATVYMDTSRKGCFCNYNMTNIDQSYKTCFLTPKKLEPMPGTTRNVTCEFQPGDGYGGGRGGREIYLSNLSGHVCLKACTYLSEMDASVNGMTVYANTSRPGCWCEKRMGSKVKNTPAFKTCKFTYPGEEGAASASSLCSLQHGESDGIRTYVGRLGESECVRTCGHVTRLDGTLNGVTWNTETNSCFCKRNVTTIGKFKTCLLNDVKVKK